MAMWPRRNLFEFHDQPWCPEVLRRAVTDCVSTAWVFTGLWRNTVPHLAELMRRVGTTRIIDICSGSGGPLPLAAGELVEAFPDLSVVLTDLYPKVDAEAHVPALSRGRIRYHHEPVDAMDVPSTLTGLRTMFGAFHHFSPEDAVRLLRSASRAGQPIAIFEFQRRDFLRNCVPPTGLVGMSPLVALWLAPFRWWRVALTLFPLIPALYAWDSVVSILRTYTPEELADLARQAESQGYRWEVREARTSGRGRMTCLLGFPDARGGTEIIYD